ncbi:MAG: S8 family peptidase [Eubacterium sp.]|jgi:hypothetical protein|nr:S8 family peptidase [Eubacterium sp.]
MDCHEAVYSNDYYDLIGSISSIEPGLRDLCKQDIANRYAVYYLNREKVPPLSVGAYKYINIPKCYTILNQQALEASGITRVQTQRNLELFGSGIMIGFVDSGIHYENNAFRNTDGSSRIAAIWDQTIDTGAHPQGFIYGTEYTKEEIDFALQQENPRDYVPQTDEIGHGTMLASIAAGSEDLERDFIGAAPYADVAVVKLKPAKQYLRDFYYIRDGAVAYQENDVFTAIDYLNRLADKLGKPMVICLGLGTNQGHRGSGGRMTSYLDDIAAMYRRAVCIAVGDEANARHHFYGSVSESASERAEINVTEDMRGFIVELWGNSSELFAVSVTSPTGEVLNRVAVWNGQQQKQYFLLENTRVVIDYQLGTERSRESLVHINFENPVKGLWIIDVFPYRILNGNFNMYLPISDFLEEEVYFVRSNPDMTITVPSSAKIPMAVGGYNSVTNGIYIESGRGYSMDGSIKPDYAAPAVNVTAVNQFGRLEGMSGTSAAVAISAGASALLMEWNIANMGNLSINSVEIRNQIINGTQRVSNQLYPNREEGYGRLDIYQSILNMRNL